VVELTWTVIVIAYSAEVAHRAVPTEWSFPTYIQTAVNEKEN